MIGLIVSAASKAVGGYFEHSAKKAKAKSDLKIAEIEAKTAVKKAIAKGDVQWENKVADQMSDSIKDEIWVIWFVAFLTACFIPPAQPYIEQGIKFLGMIHTEAPFISYGILASIAASFGLKSIGKFTK